MSTPVATGGLAWPSHESGPTAPPGYDATGEERRPTRKPLPIWDRTKFLWAMVAIFGFLLWREMADNPLLSFSDALRKTVETTTALQILFVIELLRQSHYLLSEHSSRWHHFVTVSVFGRWNRFVERRDPWTRYRFGRLAKLALIVFVIGLVLGALWDMPFYEALFDAPGRIGRTLFGTAQGLPLIFQLILYPMLLIGQFGALFWFLSRGGVDTYRPNEIKTRFAHVWGQDPVLERVKENMVFLENPRAIEERGGYVPGGILLWGPPGTGKTLMAEAVAGETGRPFVFVDPGAFINMFMGVGVLKVKGLFRKLRKLALRYGGVIVFFDEADTLGSRGGGALGGTPPGGGVAELSRFDSGCSHWASPPVQQYLRGVEGGGSIDESEVHGVGRVRRIIMGGMGGGGGGMGTLQALLTEMSGLKKPRGFMNKYVRRWLNMEIKPPLNYRILVMMATNLPDVLDPALLRPGRIDRTYQVGYPSTDGRERTFRGYLAKISHDLTDEQVRRLAVISTRATGASIKDIVNEAVVVALRDERDVVTYTDVIKAKHLKTHGPADDWRYSDWEGHAVAVHEACHAVAMYRLKKREAIDVATIERRGGTGGFVAPVPLEDQFVEWRSELESEVMTFLASLAGERLFFEGDNSQGVGGDLRASTLIVMRMMAVHGMGDSVASHSATLGFIGRQPTSVVEDGTDRQFLETDFGRRVEAELQELLERVKAVLEGDTEHVLAVAHALETHKTISGEDIVAVFEGTLGPLVDGSVYHDPEVRAELAAYHAAVLAAMRDHTRVDRRLPELRPYPAPTELVAAGPVAFGNGGAGRPNGGPPVAAGAPWHPGYPPVFLPYGPPYGPQPTPPAPGSPGQPAPGQPAPGQPAPGQQAPGQQAPGRSGLGRSGLGRSGLGRSGSVRIGPASGTRPAGRGPSRPGLATALAATGLPPSGLLAVVPGRLRAATAVVPVPGLPASAGPDADDASAGHTAGGLCAATTGASRHQWRPGEARRPAAGVARPRDCRPTRVHLASETDVGCTGVRDLAGPTPDPGASRVESPTTVSVRDRQCIPLPTLSRVPDSVSPTIGWGVLHLFCKPSPFADVEAITAAVKSAEADDHQVVTVALLGHKADLAVMALGPDFVRLRRLQSELAAAGLDIVDSYVSLTEVSEYAQGLPEAMKEARLHPRLPPDGKPAWCFYPMSKRRGSTDNWYRLPYDERLELMHGHGRKGREFAGRVLQLITGSTGLDDFEWGVTLFATAPDDLKDVVYSMRFDEASAVFAEFGAFYTGFVASVEEALLETAVPHQPD